MFVAARRIRFRLPLFSELTPSSPPAMLCRHTALQQRQSIDAMHAQYKKLAFLIHFDLQLISLASARPRVHRLASERFLTSAKPPPHHVSSKPASSSQLASSAHRRRVPPYRLFRPCPPLSPSATPAAREASAHLKSQHHRHATATTCCRMRADASASPTR